MNLHSRNPYEEQSTSSSSRPVPSSMSKMNHMIHSIDSSNRELLALNHKLMNTSLMSQHQQLHPIIQNIENSLRSTLSELIDSIKEYFKDIDSKLKQVGSIINQQMSTKNNYNQKSSEDLKFDILAERMKNLEVSLQETKQNEKKLINVIQGLMNKYQIKQEPTIIRETPDLHGQFNRNRMSQSVNDLSFNPRGKVASRQNNKDEEKQQAQATSFYQELYTIEESHVEEPETRFRLRQITQDPSDQVFIKKLYSKCPLPDNKKSLKGESRGQLMCQARSLVKSDKNKDAMSTSASQTDKKHRLNFMIGKLNI